MAEWCVKIPQMESYSLQKRHKSYKVGNKNVFIQKKIIFPKNNYPLAANMLTM